MASAAAAEPLDAQIANELKPGQYRVAEDPGKGPVEMVVSLAEQRLFVYRGEDLVAISTVSTGFKGHETPIGTYPILQKKQEHFSNRYKVDGKPAKMPQMQRLTWTGIAMHAGAVRNRPASHGCVRLPPSFAKTLYSWTRLGDEVRIVGGRVTDPPAVAARRQKPFQPEVAAEKRATPVEPFVPQDKPRYRAVDPREPYRFEAVEEPVPTFN